MEDYREAQRQKWLRQQEANAAAAGAETSTNASSGSAGYSAPPASAPPSTPASSSAGMPSGGGSDLQRRWDALIPPASSQVAAGAQVPANVRRAHILPIGGVRDEIPEQRRLDIVAPELRRRREERSIIKTGMFITSGGVEFVVVKCEPDEGVLHLDTDYFFNGDPIVRFEKVQFICLWDFESRDSGRDANVLFNEYISPYFKSIVESGPDMGSIATIGETMKIFDLNFQVMAAHPTPPDIGIIDTNTMVYADWDTTPEFEKIHIVPFQDTLPHAYEFDVFTDYLKPYLTSPGNKHAIFKANDHFTYQGVQFKVVCCEPQGPARIGRNTTIYCEGVLHPSLRNLLPPELLEQLSQLPPGLQMLLLNTEALAGGYEERMIEVQEMLSRRRGVSDDVINRLEVQRWRGGDNQAQEQCMVCLSNFVQDEELRRLPCGHVFHSSCIEEWLRRAAECPICKANVDRAVRQY